MLPIHLIHLAVQNVSATAKGCVLRHVTCEHCGEKYVYQLREEAKGRATAIRFLHKAQAKMRAEGRAKVKLGKKLAVGSAPPACPLCGFYQHDMVEIMRNRRWRVLGWSSVFTGMALAMVWIVTSLAGLNELMRMAEMAAGAAVVGATTAALWIALRDFNRHPAKRTREALGERCGALPAREWEELVGGRASESVELEAT